MTNKLVGPALCAMLFALCSPVGAQQPKKSRIIGYLTQSDTPRETARFQGIRLALRELGNRDGQNIAIEFRTAKGKPDRLPELAGELVRLKVELIVAGGGDPVVSAAKKATRTIPIVMTGAGIDPVVARHVESLARPGGNITGITNLTRELGGKRLELLKEAVPKIVQVAVLYEARNPGSLRELKEVIPVVAHQLLLTVQPWEVENAEGFEKVFSASQGRRPHGLYVTSSPLITAHLKRAIDFGLKSRLASVGSTTEFVESGGFLSYDADLKDGYRRIAAYVNKILNGAKPADLPVQQPTKFEFAVNLKTAKRIGLTIPPNVLFRADRVIR